MDLRCYNCGSALEHLSLPYGRLDQCRACGRYVHACRMCVYYDPTETSKQCTEDDAEKVHDKVNANFCDYYRPSTTAFDGAAKSAEQKARAELDALFGESDARRSSATDATDETFEDAEALFRK